MPRPKTKTYHFKEKKMPRTIGAKDKKPRKVSVKAKRPTERIPRPVNWEGLAKNLQRALRDEIVENQKRATDIDTLIFKIRSLEHQIIGFQAVISYLETKSGHDTV
jgi:hypothetical protein